MYVTSSDAYIQGFQLFVKNLRGKTLVLDGCPGDTIDRLSKSNAGSVCMYVWMYVWMYVCMYVFSEFMYVYTVCAGSSSTRRASRRPGGTSSSRAWRSRPTALSPPTASKRSTRFAVHPNTHTCIHTYMHSYIHTYIHMPWRHHLHGRSPSRRSSEGRCLV